MRSFATHSNHKKETAVRTTGDMTSFFELEILEFFVVAVLIKTNTYVE